jgi:hypothetical protein
VLPPFLLDEGAEERAARLVDDGTELAASPGLAEAAETDPAQLARVLSEIGQNFRNFAVVARRESAQLRDMHQRPDVVVTVPEFDSDIHDLPGLLRLGERIWT